MKKQLLAAFVFLISCFALNSFAQEREFVINKVNLISEVGAYDYANNLYNYDGVLVFMRTVENRKRVGDETYDALTYKCSAEAWFFKDRKNYITVDSVVVNGLRLTPNQAGNAYYYYTTDKYIHGVPSLSPNVMWNVYGGENGTSYSGESLKPTLKFPDFYYVSSYGSEIVINSKTDWSFSISKWLTGAGFALGKPDLMRGWIVSPSFAPHKSLSNFSPSIKKDNVSEENYVSTIEGRYDTFISDVCLPGTGSAFVRTYKLYPVKVTDPKTGGQLDWLFVMGVESEVPVTFR
jgi:hypothetical protein